MNCLGSNVLKDKVLLISIPEPEGFPSLMFRFEIDLFKVNGRSRSLDPQPLHIITKPKVSFRGSKGDTVTHLNIRKITFADFLNNKLKISLLSLTLGRYHVCRSRCVKQDNNNL